MKLEILTFLCFGSLVSCQLTELNCYDCGPGDPQSCKAPQDNNIKTTNCQEAFERSITTLRPGDRAPAMEPECFILYLNQTGGQFPLGIYRGCVWKSTGQVACDELKERYGQYGSCKSCPNEKCNTENIDEVGAPDAAASLVGTAAILFINVYLLMRIF